jgi:hypothetical protein
MLFSLHAVLFPRMKLTLSCKPKIASITFSVSGIKILFYGLLARDIMTQINKIVVQLDKISQ